MISLFVAVHGGNEALVRYVAECVRAIQRSADANCEVVWQIWAPDSQVVDSGVSDFTNCCFLLGVPPPDTPRRTAQAALVSTSLPARDDPGYKGQTYSVSAASEKKLPETCDCAEQKSVSGSLSSGGGRVTGGGGLGFAGDSGTLAGGRGGAIFGVTGPLIWGHPKLLRCRQ